MRKLLLLLSIALMTPALSATPSQGPAIDGSQELRILREENAKLKENQAKREADELLFEKHRNALIKNGVFITTGAAIGGIITIGVFTRILARAFER